VSERIAFYLAGKVSGPTGRWRDPVISEFPEGYATSHHRLDTVPRAWRIITDGLGDGLDYTGPYLEICDGIARQDRFRARVILGRLSREAVRMADVTFAWISSQDVYGTLTEVATARALGKQVWVSGPCYFPDMWLAYTYGTTRILNPLHQEYDGGPLVEDPLEALGILLSEYRSCPSLFSEDALEED